MFHMKSTTIFYFSLFLSWNEEVFEECLLYKVTCHSMTDLLSLVTGTALPPGTSSWVINFPRKSSSQEKVRSRSLTSPSKCWETKVKMSHVNYWYHRKMLQHCSISWRNQTLLKKYMKIGGRCSQRLKVTDTDLFIACFHAAITQEYLKHENTHRDNRLQPWSQTSQNEAWPHNFINLKALGENPS